MAGPRELNDVLAISFTCAANAVEYDDVVKISANNTVALVTSPQDFAIGRVKVYKDDATVCTVATKFRGCHYDVVAGESLSAGNLFCYGVDGKAYKYTPGSKAVVEGATAGPFAITQSSNDAIKFAYKGGATQTVTLTAGTARTTAQVVDEINAGTTGFVASVSDDDKIVLTADELWSSVAVVTSTAAATLGLTVAVTYGTFPSHDWYYVDGVVAKGGNTNAEITVLEF